MIIKDAVRAMTVARKEMFLPLSHPPGEAQVNFGFAEVVVRGVPTQVAVFVLSLSHSGEVYCQAFPQEYTEVFLEGHARAFRLPQRGAPADRLRQHQDSGGGDHREPGAASDARV